MKTDRLLVANGSDVNALAHAIISRVDLSQSGRNVELSAIGAGAVNQAAKAVAVARGLAATRGWDLYTAIGFGQVKERGTERTCMLFRVRLI